jgi:hypothetical protein
MRDQAERLAARVRSKGVNAIVEQTDLPNAAEVDWLLKSTWTSSSALRS